MARSKEVIWWSLFSAGGIMAALFVPVLVILTGFGIPFGIDGKSADYNHMRNLLGHWLTKAFLLVVLPLVFVHCLHRIRHTLIDLGLRPFSIPLGVVCYALAGFGTVMTLIVVSKLP